MPLKKIIRTITVIALFLLPVFPLIVANSFFFPFITGKAFIFRILVEIAFAGWVLLVFMDEKYRPRLTPLTIAITIFAFVALLADLLGVNPLRSIWSNFERMEGWITVIHLWALFLVLRNVFGNYSENKKIWRNWISANLGVATVIISYGLLQLAGVLSIHQGSSRLDASLGNSAYLAVYMLFILGLSLFMFVSSGNYWKFNLKHRESSTHLVWSFILISLLVFIIMSSAGASNAFFESLKTFVTGHPMQFILGLIFVVATVLYPYKLIPLLSVFIVFQTQTRGSILGLIGGIMLALLVYAIFAHKKDNKYRLISLGIIAFIIIIGIVFWTNRHSNFVKNNAVLNRLATISLNDVKTQARGYIWPMAFDGAMKRPILGWGQENFNYIFNANYNPAMYAQEQWFDRAHNVFIDWLVAAGIIGLISYLAIYVLLIMRIWHSSLTLSEKSIFTGLVAAYFIHNIFVFDNIASYVMFFAVISFIDSEYSGKEKILLGDKTYSRDAVEYVIAPIVIVVLVLSLYFVNYRVALANSRLIDGLIACSGGANLDTSPFIKALAVNSTTANQEIREQILNCSTRVIGSPQVPGPIKQQFFALSLEEIKNQVNYVPKDARIYTLGGSFMNNVSQFDKAQILLEKAHELSPNKQSIIFELVTAYLNQNSNIDKAVEYSKKAYELSPNYFDAKFAYATTLIVAGKNKEAKELFKDSPDALNAFPIVQAYIIRKEYYKAIDLLKILIVKEPDNTNYYAKLAEVQYTAGLKYDAIATLRTLVEKKPELKQQIDNTIKEISK